MANTARLAYGVGTAERIALATQAASATRFAMAATEFSGVFTMLYFIGGEVYALRARRAAIRQGTCQLFVRACFLIRLGTLLPRAGWRISETAMPCQAGIFK